MKWYKCPNCQKNLFVIKDGAVVKGIQMKCKQCKKIIDVKIEPVSQ